MQNGTLIVAGSWETDDAKYVSEFWFYESQCWFQGRVYFRGVMATMCGCRHTYFPYSNQEWVLIGKKEDMTRFVKFELMPIYRCPPSRADQLISELTAFSE